MRPRHRERSGTGRAQQQAALEGFSAAGFSPQVQLQTRYWDFIGGLVGACVGVMFEHVAAKYKPQHIASRPLVDPATQWQMGLIWRENYVSRAGNA